METDSTSAATNLLLTMTDNNGTTTDLLNIKQTLSELDRSENFQNELAKAYEIDFPANETMDEQLKIKLEEKITFLDHDLDDQNSSIFIVNDQPKIEPDSSPIRYYSMEMDDRRQMSKRKKNIDKYFPRILWRIVNECTSDAIKWSSNGTTILIDYEKFQQQYLDTNHFKTNKIISFVRQLNLYGFNKVPSHSKQSNQYVGKKKFHEFWNINFNRDCPHLLTSIRRRASTTNYKQQRIMIGKENANYNNNHDKHQTYKGQPLQDCIINL